MSDTAPAFTWPAGIRAAVSLSFDDARASQLTAGIPILNRHGVRASFYVMQAGISQQPAAWKAAVATGHEMGNHTMKHPCSGNFKWARQNALEEYSLEQMAAELDEASDVIEGLLGVRPTTYAYTCGQKFIGRGAQTRSYVPLVAERFIAGRGFRDESTNDPGYCDLAQLAGVDGDGLSFRQYREWINRAAAEGAWLVFACHDVSDAPRQALSPRALEELCRYCVNPANGIWIGTVGAIAAYVAAHRR